MAGETARNAWHLDKNVPIAIIGALILQTASVAWWAAQIDARVSALEQVSLDMTATRDALSRLDEKLSNIKESVRRIEQRQDDQERNER